MRTLKTIENIRGYSTIENPLNIVICLYLYQHTISKKLINSFSDLIISANYKKTIHMKKDIANSIKWGDKKIMIFSFHQTSRKISQFSWLSITLILKWIRQMGRISYMALLLQHTNRKLVITTQTWSDNFKHLICSGIKLISR